MRHTSAARLHLISIHAPRTGSDGVSLPRELRRIYFNPRSPHGERLKLSGRTSRQKEFQSTLPARGATKLTFVGRKR